MRITKYNHSCLLVESFERTALFDPGVFSEAAVDATKLKHLDDIFITHDHADHFSQDLVKQLVAQFPDVRITAPQSIVDELAKSDIIASSEPPQGATLFNSPHENGEPLFHAPDQIGVHYLDLLSHPGDSHSFVETKAVLALPMTAPWGTTVRAINLALELKPQYVIPIHDWLWRDEFRIAQYKRFQDILAAQGITFLALETAVPVEIAKT